MPKTEIPSELLALQKLGVGKGRKQIFNLFESDVECFRVGSELFLSMNCDSISEEVTQGLYTDPSFIGKMLATSCLSDLHAAGVTPMGFLLSSQWKSGTTSSFKRKLIEGCESVLTKHGVHIEGGDSGSGAAECFTGTAFGITKSKPISRIGASAGDLLFILGKNNVGLQPARSFDFLFSKSKGPGNRFDLDVDNSLKFNKIKNWRPFAKASIDTSDGIFNSLYVLAFMNKLGFDMKFSKESVHPVAARFFSKNKWPLEMAWANDLGDLNTLIVVSQDNREKFLKINEAICLGKFTSDTGRFTFSSENTDQGRAIPLSKATKQARDVSEIKKSLQAWAKFF